MLTLWRRKEEEEEEAHQHRAFPPPLLTPWTMISLNRGCTVVLGFLEAPHQLDTPEFE